MAPHGGLAPETGTTAVRKPSRQAAPEPLRASKLGARRGGPGARLGGQKTKRPRNSGPFLERETGFEPATFSLGS